MNKKKRKKATRKTLSWNQKLWRKCLVPVINTVTPIVKEIARNSARYYIKQELNKLNKKRK